MIAIRVRLSALNLTEEVGAKGSGLSVADSTAMARVEAELLSSTGAPVAACATVRLLRATKLTDNTAFNECANDDRKRQVVRMGTSVTGSPRQADLAGKL
jgi:hypothetical protein